MGPHRLVGLQVGPAGPTYFGLRFGGSSSGVF